MTGSGMLQHEGASAPRDPNDIRRGSVSTMQRSSRSSIFVLDISDLALEPGSSNFTQKT